nr:zeatin O-glucosyltransferase-like [Ipomoea trifida]
MASTKHALPGSCGGGGGAKVVVVMVPFPAQGHLNQLLQLSRLISSYNIPVHFVGTATHNRQARLRVHGWNPFSAANIHFHEFPTANAAAAAVPNPPAESRFPAHILSSYQAASLLRDPVGKLLRSLAGNNSRVVVIHDSLMGSVVQDAAGIPNAESYIFHSVSAFTIFLFIWEKMGKPFAVDADLLRDLPSLEGCFSPEFESFLKAQYDFLKSNSGRIYNTCRALEGPFLELLSREEISGKKKQWALGPFNPVHVLRIGILVKDWARRDQIVTSSAVEHAVKRLMATEEGERMRQRAADFGCAMKKAVADGGVSRMELDGFVDHIARS